jgi:circadian clock protein KaiB
VKQRPSGSYAKTTLSPDQSQETKRELEQAACDQRTQPYLFRLFITGTTPASARAVEATRSACEAYLQGRYELNVVDIYQKPSLARDQQIIATPTLIRMQPLPTRRYVGDLSKVTGAFFGSAPNEKN